MLLIYSIMYSLSPRHVIFRDMFTFVSNLFINGTGRNLVVYTTCPTNNVVPYVTPLTLTLSRGRPSGCYTRLNLNKDGSPSPGKTLNYH